MVTTVDNVKLKRGDKAYEIGVDADTGKFVVGMGVVHGGASNMLHNEDRCWVNYGLCQAECLRLNMERQKENEYLDWWHHVAHHAQVNQVKMPPENILKEWYDGGNSPYDVIDNIENF